jgi:hypothetical protein
MCLKIRQAQRDFPDDGSVSNEDMFTKQIDISWQDKPFAVISPFKAHQLGDSCRFGPTVSERWNSPQTCFGIGIAKYQC